MMVERDGGNKLLNTSPDADNSLKRYHELLSDLIEFSNQFEYEEGNDRAVVIVGAAFLDTLLERILVAFLVDNETEVRRLLYHDRPLGTFSARTTMAYCLGLINKAVRDDLRLIGKIRNRFAHDLYASFEDERIKSWCFSLKWHRIAFVGNPPSDATTRDHFQVGVHQLITYLNGVVDIAGMEKRKIEGV